MRELVSNAFAHSQVQQLEVDFRLERDRIELTIIDNGIGRNPRVWSHGLRLGGVRSASSNSTATSNGAKPGAAASVAA